MMTVQYVVECLRNNTSDIKNIKNPFDTKEQLSELVEKNRRENHVYMRENMMTGGNGADLDMDPGEMFGQDDDCDGNH